MGEPSPIGAQLRKLRAERGLSQAELAELAEVSVDLVSKLEQGSRQSARLSSLSKLAQVLDVSLSELLDKRPRMDASSEAGSLLAVRDVLLSPATLPGVDPRDDEGEATPAKDLEAAVRAGWESYWSGQLGRVAGRLPGLIGEARVTVAAVGGPAAQPLAQAYQLAACLMVHMGKDEIAAIAVERALHAALRADDELQWATLNGTYSWVLGHQGRFREAEQHATSVAERIEPAVSKAEPEQLTVWGGLLLTALAAAAAGGRGDEAREYISWARAGAARFESDRHDYWVSFGPTQVAMQATHAYTVLGHPSRALGAAKDVRRHQLFRVAYGRHLLDVAQAHLDGRGAQAATVALQEARSQSPEWFRHQGVARSAVAELVRRQRRLTPAVRALARAVELE